MNNTLCLPPAEVSNWDAWLTDLDLEIKKLGYKKFNQDHKREDYAYWKTFYDGPNKIYQVGVLIFDFRKYSHIDPFADRVSIQYECMLLSDNRIDLSVSNNIPLAKFEEMAADFYSAMAKYL